MPLFVTSNIIGIFLLAALAVFAGVSLFARYRQRSYRARKGLTVFRVAPERVGENLMEFLQMLPPPFAFEIVVHNLGKGAQYYLTVPNVDAKRVSRIIRAEEIQDFDIHYSGSIQKAVYLKEGKGWPNLNVNAIDFSKINEIGEGVVIQFVSSRKGVRQRAMNIRLLVTAPSEFQAAEILESVKAAFSGFRVVEVKNTEFLKRVYFREFDANEVALIY